jgi:hypothetical protein
LTAIVGLVWETGLQQVVGVLEYCWSVCLLCVAFLSFSPS